MSNGTHSGSSYIIICNGRITAAASANPLQQRIVAMSGCIANFAGFLRVAYGEGVDETIQPLSSIQHYMMEHLGDMTKAEAEAKFQEAIKAMSALEGAYS